MTASHLRWPLLALLGLLIAAAVALLATQIVSQQIGISSEPLTAGRELSPSSRPAAAKRRDQRAEAPATTAGSQQATTAGSQSAPTTAPPAAAGDEDSGGGEQGDD